MFSSVIIPILLFGGLVFFHELGHFSVAKWCNVYVERFAIGFGPSIAKWTWGETEYALCLFPLGGYVKMRGQEDMGKIDEKELTDPRSFATQPVWNRIAIVAMGPIFNLILPVIVFGILYMVGVPTPSSMVGTVVPGSPAQEAGLRSGDRIVQIENQKVQKWRTLNRIIADRGDRPTDLVVQRGGETIQVTVQPRIENGMNEFGQETPQGKIGIDLGAPKTVVGISDPSSMAYEKGLRTGDLITKVNGEPVEYFWQIDQQLSQPSEQVQISYMDGTANGVEKTVTFGSIESLRDIGAYSSEMFVAKVQEDSIAQEKGVQEGDHILALNGQPVVSWFGFRKAITNNTGDPLSVTLMRQGQVMNIDLVPKEVSQRDVVTNVKAKVRQMGVNSMAQFHDVDVYKEQYSNPFKSFARGFEETWLLTKNTVIGLGKLFSGQLTVKTLGGPISIFYMAGSTYKSGGWMSFFRLMAVLSITLGVLNLLPIPVLDGGHLFFYAIEVIRGKPVPMKIMEYAQQGGLFVLLGLMLLVFYVDIDRFFVDKIKALFQ
jgi:regulator of sigma E protease